MTKKDYEKIAVKLNGISKMISNNDLVGETPDKVFNLVIESLSDVFQADNLRYQRYKFMEAVYKN